MPRSVTLLTAALLLLVSAAATVHAEDAVAMSFGGSTIALWNDEIALMRPVIEKQGFKFLTDDPQFKVEKQVQD